MPNKRFLLLDTDCCEASIAEIFYKATNEDLVLSPQGRANALLMVLDEFHQSNVGKLANYIENRKDIHSDSLSLFVIWTLERKLHEYSPFIDGVRKLVKEY